MATKNQIDNTEAAIAEVAEAPKAPKAAKASAKADLQPVQLASHYAFYDEDGEFFQWLEGVLETDIEKIAMLIERKAPIIEVTE